VFLKLRQHKIYAQRKLIPSIQVLFHYIQKFMLLGQHVPPYLGHLQAFYYHDKKHGTTAFNVSFNWTFDMAQLVCRRSVCPPQQCDRIWRSTKTKDSTYWIALRSTATPHMRRKLPQASCSLPFPSIPFHLPTLHALASSDLHCATHLYLTNRYLITRTAILPSCIWYRYSYADPTTGSVSTVYGPAST
jgi:hypothetical protein